MAQGLCGGDQMAGSVLSLVFPTLKLTAVFICAFNWGSLRGRVEELEQEGLH